jgi:hypothetical protein
MVVKKQSVHHTQLFEPDVEHLILLFIYLVSCVDNTIASRIPAARPQGSLFAVPGFLSLCVCKVNSPSEEEDHENTIREDKDCIRTWYHLPGVLQ